MLKLDTSSDEGSSYDHRDDPRHKHSSRNGDPRAASSSLHSKPAGEQDAAERVKEVELKEF